MKSDRDKVVETFKAALCHKTIFQAYLKMERVCHIGNQDMVISDTWWWQLEMLGGWMDLNIGQSLRETYSGIKKTWNSDRDSASCIEMI